MEASEFVSAVKQLKEDLLRTFLSPDGESEVAGKIASLKLDDHQTQVLHTILDEALTDSFYSLLRGLDGASSLGDIQQCFQIRDEDGNLVAEAGDIEAEAWEQFHGDSE